MPSRSYSATTGYRYGFNGKEQDKEIYGAGNEYNYGDRLYDPRIGRWYSIDLLERKFPYVSPFVYAIDNPLNILDPDGQVVIFINGQNILSGGKPSYWNGVDKKIMDQIGDHIAIYRDGSSGGFFNTLFCGNILRSNLNPTSRIVNGYMQGALDAADIISKLRRDRNDPNKITETIKIITHSMGTAYSRGYALALEEYVETYNKKNPNNKLTGFKIETQVDIAAFQGSRLPADKNVTKRFYMSGDADDVANGKGKGTEGRVLKFLSPSSNVPDATQIKTLPGTTHNILDYGEDFDIRQIPRADDFFKTIAPNGKYPKSASDATHVSIKIGSVN